MYKLWPWQAQYMNILTFIWPLWPWPSTYLKMFQMALLLLKGNSCAKPFWNPCIIVQVMVWTNPDWCTDAHWTKIVTTRLYVSLTRKRADKKSSLNYPQYPPPPLSGALIIVCMSFLRNVLELCSIRYDRTRNDWHSLRQWPILSIRFTESSRNIYFYGCKMGSQN